MNALSSSNTIPVPPRALTEDQVAARLRGRPDRMLDVGHSKLAAWRFGQGPDVLCVHGWPLHAATWRRLVPHLARDFTVHLVDLPGTGQSEWDDASRIDLLAHAESVRRAVDLLGLRRFAYVAHDSGAAITRLAAADDPRVFANVLGNTEIPGHIPWQVKAFVLAAKVPPIWRAYFRTMSLGAVRRGPLGFGGCFTDPRYVDGDFGDWFVKPLLSSPRVAEGQTRLVLGLDGGVLGDLARVHARQLAPSLLVWGPDDPFFPIAGARAMLPQFASAADLIEIPRGRLFVHEDRVEEFAGAARPFLLRHA
jgi:haloalkane dehalogenase